MYKTNTVGRIKPWKMRLVRLTGSIAKARNVDKMLVLSTYYTRPPEIFLWYSHVSKIWSACGQHEI